MTRIRAARSGATVPVRALVCGLALVLGACGSSTGEPTPKPPRGGDAALHARLPQAIRRSGVVRVATDVPYPPFEMFRTIGQNQLTGLDYDLGQQLGARLGVRFAFGEQKFDGIIPALQAGKYDLVMSAMTDTAERERVLDFVDYFRSGTGLLVLAGNPESVKTMLDLCGRTAATQSGGQQIAFIKSRQRSCRDHGRREIRLLALPKFSDTQLALRSHKADAVVLDKPTLAYAAKTVGDGRVFQVVDDPAAAGGYQAQPGGIGVLKGHRGLVAAVRAALQQLMRDGTYRRVLARYGLGSIAVDRASVNASG